MLYGEIAVKKIRFYDVDKALVRVVRPKDFQRILFVNVHFYRPGEFHEVHSHEDREEIFVCFQGRGELVMGDKVQPVERGDILLFKANDLHGFKADEVDPLAYVCIGISLS